MSLQSLQTFNTTLLAFGVLGVGYFLYKTSRGTEVVYDGYEQTIGKLVDAASDYYYGGKYGDEITHDVLPIGNLGKWMFYPDWTMTEEALSLYNSQYEREMALYLDVNNKLREQYRDQIRDGEFAQVQTSFFGVAPHNRFFA